LFYFPLTPLSSSFFVKLQIAAIVKITKNNSKLMVISSLPGEGLGNGLFQRNYCVQQKPSGKGATPRVPRLSRFLVFLGFPGPCASQRANQTVVPVWDVLGRSTRRPGTQNPRMPHVRCQILGSLIDGCCWRLFVFVRAAESRKLGEQPQEQQSYDIFSIEIIIIYYY